MIERLPPVDSNTLDQFWIAQLHAKRNYWGSWVDPPFPAASASIGKYEFHVMLRELGESRNFRNWSGGFYRATMSS